VAGNLVTRRIFLGTAAAMWAQPQTRRSSPQFQWPEGKRVAVSLTFDDARPSQLDVGVPLLNRHGVKATFYLSPRRAATRLEGWKKAAADGHEMANHSLSHPCTANYGFSVNNALEDYTEARMASDLDTANEEILKMLGVKPESFAYPCGQTFVGRGKQTRSYVPLVAKRFLTGRGYLDESPNDPVRCDFAKLMGTAFDDMSFEQMLQIITKARNEGRWVIFVGHDVGKRAYQTTDSEALEKLCAYAKDPANGVWIDTVLTIARYVQKRRS